MNTGYNYKKGLPAMAVCYFIWGFQPLYFALDKTIDTTLLLALRIIWAAVFCFVILAVSHKLGDFFAIFKDKKTLMKEIPASFLLLADWGIYLFAVRMGKIMECSMGYYILPIVMFAFGVVLYKEKFRLTHIAALVFIIAGIVFSTDGFGGFPYVTVLLSVCFAVYSALKKSVAADSIVSTTAEIIMMVPIALIYILFFADTSAGADFSRHLFSVGSGIVTALPMLFFAIGVKCLPLTLSGIFQYISPSLGLICSLILGESFTEGKIISFLFIWAGVIIYSVAEFKNARKI